MPAVKHERVQAAQCRRQRADFANDPIDEELDRLGGQRAVTGQKTSRTSLLTPEIPSKPDFL